LLVVLLAALPAQAVENIVGRQLNAELTAYEQKE
jgi:hypothetical protein